MEKTYKLKLSFIGKDSVFYQNELEIPKNIYDALKSLQTGEPEAELFKASSKDVNNFLKQAMPECTAKLFRTAYGTKLIAEELQGHPINSDMSEAEKRKVYDDACLVVAKKLNHQKNISKNFDSQIEKIDESIQKAKDNIVKAIEKGKEKAVNLESQISIAKKAYADKPERLEEKLDSIKEQQRKIKERVKKAEQRLQKLEISKDFKKSSANYALGTARTAYSSPKIVFSWCKDNSIDPSFVYSKTLLEKFSWAKDVDEKYWKNY